MQYSALVEALSWFYSFIAHQADVSNQLFFVFFDQFKTSKNTSLHIYWQSYIFGKSAILFIYFFIF